MKLRCLAAGMAAVVLAAPGGTVLAASTDINEIKLQRLVRGFVEGKLTDPGSAQFRNQYGGCGEVNSKNRLGGYTGFQRFMATGADLVVLERDSGLSASDFQQVWDRVCGSSPTGAARPRQSR